jgi:hypothetical protein
MSPGDVIRRPLEIIAGQEYPTLRNKRIELHAVPYATEEDVRIEHFHERRAWQRTLFRAEGPRRLIREVVEFGRELAGEVVVRDVNDPNNEGEELI